MRTQFVICLAGHIDHGKSALTRALTGGTVDRLPEEKRRGITIELGFSHFDADGRRFALIDLPGHEKFIHNMVAGASGVDAALLVVAADDSVMPQTREHLALLELLGTQRGVIAITKCDLADEETLELVELEVAELVAPTFLGSAPRMRVSAHTGQGVEELRSALVACATASSDRPGNDTRFRLPIDRAFSPAGQGAVVTGTVWRGTVRVGDSLSLLPAGETVRVRRLQSQGQDVDSVTAGERAAVNLTGVKASDIKRGDELTTLGTLAPAKRLLVDLRVLPDARQGLKHRQFVRLHLGASQTTAQVLMEAREIPPGQSGFAVLRCKTPVVAEYGQPCVLRQLSPAATIGGGRIISPGLGLTDRLKRSLAAAPGLAARDLVARVAALIELRPEVTLDEHCETQLGTSLSECMTAVEVLIKRKHLVRSAGPASTFVTAERFAQLRQRLLRRLTQELERRRPASRVPASVILAGMSKHATQGMLEALLKAMVAQRELTQSNERIGLASGASLSVKQQQFFEKLLAQFNAAGRAPPTLKEVSEDHKYPLKELEPLIQVGVDDGQLVRLSPQMAIDRSALEGLRQSLAAHFKQHPTAKVGELREQWGITRKHAVPIFEYFDEQRITVRDGDLRTPGPRLSTPIGDTK